MNAILFVEQELLIRLTCTTIEQLNTLMIDCFAVRNIQTFTHYAKTSIAMQLELLIRISVATEQLNSRMIATTTTSNIQTFASRRVTTNTDQKTFRC
jgi:hypothetical protein